MNELTDKNYCVMLMGGHKIYITENQYAGVKQAVHNNNTRIIEVDGKLINVSSIVVVAPAGDIQKTEREKRGDWQCEYGDWHKRGEECAHGYMKQLNFRK